MSDIFDAPLPGNIQIRISATSNVHEVVRKTNASLRQLDTGGMRPAAKATDMLGARFDALKTKTGTLRKEFATLSGEAGAGGAGAGAATVLGVAAIAFAVTAYAGLKLGRALLEITARAGEAKDKLVSLNAITSDEADSIDRANTGLDAMRTALDLTSAALTTLMSPALEELGIWAVSAALAIRDLSRWLSEGDGSLISSVFVAVFGLDVLGAGVKAIGLDFAAWREEAEKLIGKLGDDKGGLGEALTQAEIDIRNYHHAANMAWNDIDETIEVHAKHVRLDLVAAYVDAFAAILDAAAYFTQENANLTKALSALQVITRTAAAIMAAYAQLGPIAGTAAAIGMAAVGAVQLANVLRADLSGGGSIGGAAWKGGEMGGGGYAPWGQAPQQTWPVPTESHPQRTTRYPVAFIDGHRVVDVAVARGAERGSVLNRMLQPFGRGQDRYNG